jgi:hypothetical protein
MNTFYCVRCRKRVNLSDGDICVRTMRGKGARYALRGKCPTCAMPNMTKFISADAAQGAIARYGRC